MSWISPTGHVDPGGKWDFEARAYDGNISTKAEYDAAGTDVPPLSWSDYLELTLSSPIYCDRIRYNVFYGSPGVDQISVDVYYSGSWNNIYEGSIVASATWETKIIPAGIQSVSKARVKVYNSHPVFNYVGWLYELRCYLHLLILNQTCL